MSTGPFADLPVIGALPRAAAAAKLREIGQLKAAEAAERPARAGPHARCFPLSPRREERGGEGDARTLAARSATMP